MVVKLVLKRKNENIQIWSRYSLFKNTGCRLPASSSAALIHCNLVKPQGNLDKDQHWLRWCPIAQRHQAITWTNVDYPSMAFCARGGYSSSSRAGRLGRTLWPQNSTYVAETEKGGQNSTMTPPTLEKGVNILHQYEKSEKKGVKNLQL